MAPNSVYSATIERAHFLVRARCALLTLSEQPPNLEGLHSGPSSSHLHWNKHTQHYVTVGLHKKKIEETHTSHGSSPLTEPGRPFVIGAAYKANNTINHHHHSTRLLMCSASLHRHTRAAAVIHYFRHSFRTAVTTHTHTIARKIPYAHIEINTT